jgi:hypothetical protein
MSWLVASHTVDWFTLYHFLLWGLFAALFRLRTNASLTATLLFALTLGIGWEIAEVYIEQALSFHEPFWNRWLTDPLADGLGAASGWFITTKLRRGFR